jgi:PAS domain S-box-containing protein
MFSEWLNQKLLQTGHTQASLAAVLGVSQQAVGRWCNGTARPRARRLEMLARELGTPIEEVLRIASMSAGVSMPSRGAAPEGLGESAGGPSGARPTSDARTALGREIGIWQTQPGPEGLFSFTSSSYRILGIEEGTTVRNFDFFNRVHPDDRSMFVETGMRVRGELRREEIQIRFNRPDGSWRWLRVTIEPHVGEADEGVGLVGTVQDITEDDPTAED